MRYRPLSELPDGGVFLLFLVSPILGAEAMDAAILDDFELFF
jgi:hypothetical protein